MIENTHEQIARHYSAAMDAVKLIYNLKDKASLKANRDHLKSMLAKDFWTTEDLTPFSNAM